MTERIRGRKLQKLRRIVLAQEPLCRHCLAVGKTTIATEVDHKIPLCAGGTYDRDNLQPLCTDCHKIKTLKDVRENAKRRARRLKEEMLAEPIKEHELSVSLDGYPVDE